jgi:hypothetical protein
MIDISKLSAKDKQELLDKVEKDADKCEREVHGCGRCTLAPLMKNLELGDESSIDLCLKAILPLSGGIAQTRKTCAALLGGVMAVGIAYLSGRKLEEAGKEELFEAMRLGREYHREFEKEIGHQSCYDIREVGLGRCYDNADPDEYEKFEQAGGYDLCSKVCSKAARIAGEYIFSMQVQ